MFVNWQLYTLQSNLERQTYKMNCHFMGFRQVVQRLERITPIISTLQDNQNERLFYEFLSTGSKFERLISIISTLQNKQNECSIRQSRKRPITRYTIHTPISVSASALASSVCGKWRFISSPSKSALYGVHTHSLNLNVL